ncbi:HET-domain-containing protein, partial [Coniochaeta ligniaria NRRL 30616]
MRLINTTTLDLEEFPGLVPRYAVLSHTWGSEEVTHNNLTHPKPPPFGLQKILRACLRARRDGLDYLWADTSCIDKTSSAELSEAINSMYAWYRNSNVCYAYLSDVPPGLTATQLSSASSPFRASRWFKRGWTLQELLAPKNVIFFAADWTELGTKTGMAELISEVTRIDTRYLLRVRHITGASIAHRMSWVADRTTTRPEDIAYCLLGIFDVHMPLIYGEGSRAFVRLQEEVIKISEDHSIFAW